MAFEIIWTDEALYDIESIANYIGHDSFFYATAFVQEIYKTGESLSSLAERGRNVPEIKDKHFRELFVREYRLIYYVHSSEVFILGVIHGKRDLRRLLQR